jgi:hypothetical protein
MRDYISHSQISTFKKSKEDYLRRYLYGEDTIPQWCKKYVDFGKDIHKQLELEDPKTEAIRWQIPEYPNREEKIKVNIESENGEITLYGIIDLLDLEKQIIADYKTSKNPKKQIDVDLDEQVTFYYILCKQKFGWYPKKAIIYRLETEDNGELYLTGRVDTIETTRTEEQIYSYEQEIKRLHQEMKELIEREMEAVSNGAEPLSITKPKVLYL